MRLLLYSVIIFSFYHTITRASDVKIKRQNDFSLFQALRNPSLINNLSQSRFQGLAKYLPALQGNLNFSDADISELLSMYSIQDLTEAYRLYTTLLQPKGGGKNLPSNLSAILSPQRSSTASKSSKHTSKSKRPTSTKRPKTSSGSQLKNVKIKEYRLPPKQNPKLQPLVSTSHGIIRGITVEEDGLKYYSFLGVPYAEKPERFQPPRPLKSWEGIRDAAEEETSCVQFDEYIGTIGGNEDCLYLNINTPTMDDNAGLPVIVWIHGGSFKHGTSSQNIYGPQRFIKEGVIVVNIAYRLGAFGFLSTGTKHAPGNAGLKDVVFALRWIFNNIHMFGGDNYNICLYGVSTGAAVIEYLTMSPMGQGLFQKTIIHSGSSLSTNFFARDPLKIAFKLGSHLGNHTMKIEELIDVLRKADPVDIVKATEAMDKRENPTKITFLFAPTVEETIPGEDRFLHDSPENLLRDGKYTHVPSMVGFNRDEGLINFSLVNVNLSTYLDSLNDVFEYLLMDDLLRCIADSGLKKYIIDRIKHFYFGGRRISMETIQNFVDMIGDVLFTYGVQKSISYKSQHPHAPLYYYKFAYDGAIGLSKSYIPGNVISGVAHADDVPYLFKFVLTESIYKSDPIARGVSEKLLTLYSNFLKYGNPVPRETETIPIIWRPIDNTSLPYLEITENLTMKYNPNEERFAFWSHIFALTNST